jgi:imidazolonepropionase-like amidohydrolase
MWDKLGTIEEGQLADVIALPGNPLEDITALENVGFVMIDGNVVKRPGSEAPFAGILGSPSSA